jgi:hypothetical protein
MAMFYNSPWLTGIRPNDAVNNTSAFAAPDPWRLMKLGHRPDAMQMQQSYTVGGSPYANTWNQTQRQPRQQQQNPVMQAYMKSVSSPQATAQTQSGSLDGRPTPTTPWTPDEAAGYIPSWMRSNTYDDKAELDRLYELLYDNYIGKDWLSQRESNWQNRYDQQLNMDRNAAIQYLSLLNAEKLKRRDGSSVLGSTDEHGATWDAMGERQRRDILEKYLKENATWNPFDELDDYEQRYGIGWDPNKNKRTSKVWEHRLMQGRKDSEMGRGVDINDIRQYLAGRERKPVINPPGGQPNTAGMPQHLKDVAEAIRSALSGHDEKMLPLIKQLGGEAYSGYRRAFGPMLGREYNMAQYLSLTPSEREMIAGDWDMWGYNPEDEWDLMLKGAPKGSANPYQRYTSWQ